MPKHGRAVIPFGKHKGMRIRLLPDAYLSFLTTTFVATDPQWKWLKESIMAELRFRGFRADLVDTYSHRQDDNLVGDFPCDCAEPYEGARVASTPRRCERCRGLIPVQRNLELPREIKFVLETKRLIRLED